jgi:hypothetical protein
MLETLRKIGRALDGEGVLWAVGASLLLAQHGLADDPRDIDILVAVGDADRAERALDALGRAVPVEPSGRYATRRFRRFCGDGVDVDMLAGFAIVHDRGRYEYPFDALSVGERRWIGGARIPLAALEDWFVAYQLIPEKAEKAARIEAHFAREGVKSPRLLERALGQSLPASVRKRIEALLKGPEGCL